MFAITPPRSTDDLAASLRDLHREITDFAEALAEDVFFEPQAEAWSPAGHIRHLAKSVRPVAQAMGMPKLALRVSFGTSKDGSRDYEAIRGIYHQALEDGANAGPYSPSSKTPSLEPEAWRRQIMERWQNAGRALDRALGSWSEEALDTYRLPHPILGNLTVREMLFFTLYHNAHHARRIEERLEAGS